MNETLKWLTDIVTKANGLSEEERTAFNETVKQVEKTLSIADFKIQRLEKEKNSLAVLLQQTSNELEQKRKTVEAQIREAQVESALERIRSRTIAMQHSSELPEVASIITRQLMNSGFSVLRCWITIYQYEDEFLDFWMTTYNTPDAYPVRLVFPLQFFAESIQYWKAGNESLVKFFPPREATQFVQAMGEVSGDATIAPEDYLNEDNSFWLVEAKHQFGTLGIATKDESKTDILKNIVLRFTKVFEQTYTRFLDLRKAEEQAREAQIQLALERVRARTMAMQRSDELSETAFILFQQFKQLSEALIQITIGIFNEESRMIEFSITGVNGTGEKIDQGFNLSMDEPTMMHKMYVAWKEQKKSTVIELTGQELLDWIAYRTSVSGRSDFETKVSPDEHRFVCCGFFSKGVITFSKDSPIPEETIQILERFAGEFDLTYTRFLDLQKAEAQAKEATIEAALERVRGKAMAMHNSSDLSATASTVFTELRKLGINPIRCGVGLLNKESHKAQSYSATSSADGDNLALIGWVMLEGHPVLEKTYDTWLRQEDYFPELSGEQLKSYYDLLLAGLSVPVPDWESDQKQFGHFLPFSVGCLYAWSDTPYNNDEIKILKRFAAIIDLTFRRYIELQKSEDNAKEAVKQAALDRIRADIASMRTVHDLERITPLIWNELTILGVPFIRCGVFIMDDEQQLIHTFLSTPDGKAIAAFHISYNTPGNITRVLGHWREKKKYLDHWDEAEFNQFGEMLVRQGALDSAASYLKTIPHGGFYLHFLPFLQGMLYVGNTDQLTDEEINLIQSVADAFSTAYARYEDFNKLEAAKQQVDKTLVELKQVQTQLVQSEKMASLGELTAGIAHEIQNPLNFVNNFSEVNMELINEMQEEIKNGNTNNACEIANDIKQNLEKIFHHGKRADGIVKSMLQHSRKSTGKKEPTDINALADEYLRLSFHGLRAKDKNFNATIQTNFDESIGKIEVVPQEMGRVFLNLFNNAFYAVNEKKKRMNGTFEPTVSVSTKQTKNRIEILVKDNGTGIHEKLLDKIFQPFFTTKPTGEGTGLGLSLSYDIVTKGHNGEMKVETKEGEGAKFVIELPKQPDKKDNTK